MTEGNRGAGSSSARIRQNTRKSVRQRLLASAISPVAETLELRRLLSISAGGLDSTFGAGGKTTTDFSLATHPRDQANAVVLTSGDVVAVGTSGGQFAVALYASNGGLLSTASTPIGAGSAEATGVAVDSSGNLLVGGYANNSGTSNDFVVARYKIVGTGPSQSVVLDTTFGTSGYTTTDLNGGQSDIANAIAIDGSDVVLAGQTGAGASEHLAVAAYNSSTGHLDPAFGVNGVYMAAAVDAGNGLAIAPSGNIAIAGQDLHTSHSELTLLTSGGTLLSRNALNLGTTDNLTSIVSSGGEYLAAGTADSQFVIAKATATGALDSSFGSGGETKTTIAGSSFAQGSALAVQSNGKIDVVGYETNSTSGHDTFVAARYNAGGALDGGTFAAPNGYVTTNSFGSGTGDDVANGIAIQPDGQIVAAGYTTAGAGPSFDFALARYVSNNAPTTSTSPAALNAILQTETNSPGTDVHTLVNRVGASDPDGDPLGIAITGIDNTNGTWQFSTNSGGTWTNIPAVSNGSALTLTDSASNVVRFVPTGTFAGTSSITVRGWDQTKGSNGALADVTANSAANYNSFSDNAYAANISVVAKQNTVYVNASWVGTAEGGSAVSDSFGSHTFGIDAFATVQNGVDFVASGGTVDVDAGTYHENVTISQPLTLNGANAGVSGTSSRGAESIIDGGSGTAFLVQQGFVDFNGVEVTGNTGISATGAVSIQDDFLNTSGPTISLIAGPGNVTITDDKCLSAGQAFTYQWSLASMPIGSKATLNVATSSITGGTGAISFLPDSGVFGSQDLHLVLTDNTIGGDISVSGSGAGTGKVKFNEFTIKRNSVSGNIYVTGGGSTGGSIDLGVVTIDDNPSLHGGVSMCAFQTQMTQLDLSGNTLGGPVSVSSTGTTGDVTIGVAGNQSLTISGNRTETVNTVNSHEMIMIHGQHDLTVNGRTTVSNNQDESITISSNRNETVSQDETITISGNRTVGVGHDESITIHGAQDLTLGTLTASGNAIGGNISLSATAGNILMGDGS
ncbi:MAG TPA: hypothetical protein VIM11_17660, partial [Tepidisphaeraceae bacterium]